MAKILNQSKDAHHRKAVVFCADRNVVRFAQFIADQIMQAEPDRDFDICICSFDSELVALEKVDPAIRICQIEEAPFERLRTDKRVTSTAYILLGLPEIFATDYDQIVYLDTDVYLRSGTISNLFNDASQNHAVSGVMDSTQWQGTISTRQAAYWDALGMTGKPYLNTGVLVLDVAKCREINFFQGTVSAAQRLTDLKAAHPEILFLHDQSAINMHLLGNWAPISLRWNWQTYYTSSKLAKHFDPHIMHFVANTKPWVKNPVGHTKAFLPPYKDFFKTVLQEEIIGKRYQTQKVKEDLSFLQWLRKNLTLSNIRNKINVVNPLYYTGLRGLIPMYRQYKNFKKIEQAVIVGAPVWPYADMEDGLK